MIEIINYVLAGLMVVVFGAWVVLLKSMIADHRATPKLAGTGCTVRTSGPRVSVILAARNEETYIKRCLESLCAQDYESVEIIAVDDSSEDRTGSIIAEMAKLHPNIVHLDAGAKPQGWVGKNWPCAQGRKRASGELLFFTDADTVHSPRAVSAAVSHMEHENLDAITVMPRLLSRDFWTSVTMPIITVFLNTIYSAAKVNDPSRETGYFYGSFFIIKSSAYDAVGGHSGTRAEIVEDGVLGRKIKNSKYRMLIVSGLDDVSAVWARDLGTLWNALKRLIVPIAATRQPSAVGISVGVSFLMLIPFALTPYSLALWAYGIHSHALLLASAASAAMIFAAASVDSVILRRNPAYALFAPIGGAIVALGFFAGALVPSVGSVSWRGTKYTGRDCSGATANV